MLVSLAYSVLLLRIAFTRTTSTGADTLTRSDRDREKLCATTRIRLLPACQDHLQPQQDVLDFCATED